MPSTGAFGPSTGAFGPEEQTPEAILGVPAGTVEFQILRLKRLIELHMHDRDQVEARAGPPERARLGKAAPRGGADDAGNEDPRAPSGAPSCLSRLR